MKESPSPEEVKAFAGWLKDNGIKRFTRTEPELCAIGLLGCRALGKEWSADLRVPTSKDLARGANTNTTLHLSSSTEDADGWLKQESAVWNIADGSQIEGSMDSGTFEEVIASFKGQRAELYANLHNSDSRAQNPDLGDNGYRGN